MTTKTDGASGQDGDPTIEPTEPTRATRATRAETLKAAGQEWDREATARGKAEMKDMKPWQGRLQGQDKLLLTLAIVIPAFFILTLPLRPYFIADHPVGLAFVTGSHAAVGAGAAFASIGEGSLWLVIVAGTFGKIKIDWLFWWLGRRWGRGIVNFLVPGERGRRFADRLQAMNPWVMRLFIPLSYLPGIPAGIPHILAGANGMRLRTYLLLDTIGALMVTAAVAAIGHTSGQSGVDVVLLIDQYAMWVMIALIFGMAMIPAIIKVREQTAERKRFLREVGEAYDAETARLAASPGVPAESPSPAATSPDHGIRPRTNHLNRENSGK